jgi:N6-adenosine-specific RNA methylase IME4/ParB-like chromosome segregation protein Spo0J
MPRDVEPHSGRPAPGQGKFKSSGNAAQPTRRIDEIIVGERHRKDLGDVASFARSIDKIGLLHAVVITPSGELVAGGRRLAACKELGWTDVPVRVVDLDEIVLGEFHENAQRKDFLPSEIDAIRRAIEPIESAAARSRMSEGGKGSENFATLPGKTSDKIGAFAGVSGRTVEKIAQVMQAAEAEPEKFGHLVAELDRHRGVDRAYRALRCARDEARVLGLQPRQGKCRTLVVDIAWEYDMDFLGRGAPQYALMSREEALALPVASWADEECHLYLWTTNAMAPFAHTLLPHYGFEFKTIITWAKPRYGLGAWFRGQTEHVLFGVRGGLRTRSNSLSTLFEAPVGEHSEKPERFYEIVREASYPPYGEAFQRKARPDFVNLYVEAPAADNAEAAE